MTRIIQRLISFIIGCLLVIPLSNATIFYVSSQQEFDDAYDEFIANDTIFWRDGTYSDVFMDIDKDHLYIGAEHLGKTIFTGDSRVNITSDYITLEGFQFLDGDIGTSDVIHTRGSYNVFTQINIRAYTSYKYLVVREESRFCEITYCNFENRLNLDDKNILSILVDNDEPGYHKIQHCSFKNFDGIGNDMGIEPIRIGLSSQANRISRCLVEYCYFTNCDGDGEVISSKATQNVYRYNTFENNLKAELVLRHGSEAIVYGNFFLKGKGGIRVREGQNHYIFNNYFFQLFDRPIYLQNEASDPLDNINISYNTIIDCSVLRLGNSGDNKPTNVTFANNILSSSYNNLFSDPTGSESWISNIVSGSLGFTLPSDGITIVDPLLEPNSEGYFGLTVNSPAIDAASEGYLLPTTFSGVDDVDFEILFDLMEQNRPLEIEQRDLGCSEFPHDVLIQPRATEENTGPSYNTSEVVSTEDNFLSELVVVDVYPNPVDNILNIDIDCKKKKILVLEVLDVTGKKVTTLIKEVMHPGKIVHAADVQNLTPGLYNLRILLKDELGNNEGIQTIKFIKS